MEDQLELKVVELRDSNEELEELRRLNDEKSSCKLDLEKVGSRFRKFGGSSFRYFWFQLP